MGPGRPQHAGRPLSHYLASILDALPDLRKAFGTYSADTYLHAAESAVVELLGDSCALWQRKVDDISTFTADEVPVRTGFTVIPRKHDVVEAIQYPRLAELVENAVDAFTGGGGADGTHVEPDRVHSGMAAVSAHKFIYHPPGLGAFPVTPSADCHKFVM